MNTFDDSPDIIDYPYWIGETPRAQHVGDFLADGVAMAHRQIETNTGITGIATGFPELDEMLLGLQGRELVVLVGRPLTGKTAFILNLVKHIAVESNKGVLLFSPAMSRQEVMRRLLCFLAEVSLPGLRSGQLDARRDYWSFCRAAGMIEKAKIYVDDTPGICTLELTTRALRYLGKWSLSLVIIDSLDCIAPNGRPGDRYLDWLKMLRCLKLFTMDCRVPVLALTSLSRFPRRRRWLAWRAIEQTADVVLKMQRVHQDSLRGHRVRLSVIQQRNGPTGSIRLILQEALQRFTCEDADEHEPNPDGKDGAPIKPVQNDQDTETIPATPDTGENSPDSEGHSAV